VATSAYGILTFAPTEMDKEAVVSIPASNLSDLGSSLLSVEFGYSFGDIPVTSSLSSSDGPFA
jgi:hypothetical protein